MRPRRVALVMNGAGAARQRLARQVLRELAEDGAELEAAGVSCAVTGTLAEARGAVHRAVASGAEVVLFGGGDGALAMGLSLLAEATRDGAHPIVGVLPLGTGNAFAHARGQLGAGLARSVTGRRRALLAQWRRARDASAKPAPFRPLECLGMRAPFCGFGIDAALIGDHAAARAAWGGALGKALGHLAALPGPLGKSAAPLGYAVSIATRSLPRFALAPRPRLLARNLGAPAQALDEHGGEVGAPLPAGAVLWEGECTMAAAATIPCFGFGLRMFPHAQRRPDRFQLRASDAGLVEILRNTRAAFAGTYASPRVHDFLVERLELEVTRPAPFEVSGEPMGEQRRVEVGLGPELLAI